MPATAEKPKMKSTKPLMEKRRRARINDSLMQLKTLVLDALNKNNPRHSKLEKADILEMTVRYLRMIQRQQISASVNSNPGKLGQYRSGYAECVNEVTRYLGATSATDRAPELQTQLVGHLADLCTSPNQPPSPTRTPSPPQHHRQTLYPQYVTPVQQHHQQVAEQVYAETATVPRMSPSVDHARAISRSPVPEGAQVEYALTTPVYDTQRLGMSPAYSPPPPQGATRVVVTPPASGVTTLPSGEITVVLPQEALQNGQLPTHFIPVYAPTQGPVVVTTPTSNVNLHSTDVSPRSMSPSSAGNSLPVTPVAARTSPVQHQSPVSSPVTPQYHHHHQAQTELSPESRELFYQNLDLEEAALYENHCVAKKDAMWRPW